MAALAVGSSAMEGYVRPGCVFMTLDVVQPRQQAGLQTDMSARKLASELAARDSFFATRTILVRRADRRRPDMRRASQGTTQPGSPTRATQPRCRSWHLPGCPGPGLGSEH
jgi:hypothetical protein